MITFSSCVLEVNWHPREWRKSVTKNDHFLELSQEQTSYHIFAMSFKNFLTSINVVDVKQISKSSGMISNRRWQSKLSAGGKKRDVENTPKCTRLNCILARRSSLGPPPEWRRRTYEVSQMVKEAKYAHFPTKYTLIPSRTKNAEEKKWRNYMVLTILNIEYLILKGKKTKNILFLSQGSSQNNLIGFKQYLNWKKGKIETYLMHLKVWPHDTCQNMILYNIWIWKIWKKLMHLKGVTIGNPSKRNIEEYLNLKNYNKMKF